MVLVTRPTQKDYIYFIHKDYIYISYIKVKYVCIVKMQGHKIKMCVVKIHTSILPFPAPQTLWATK